MHSGPPAAVLMPLLTGTVGIFGGGAFALAAVLTRLSPKAIISGFILSAALAVLAGFFIGLAMDNNRLIHFDFLLGYIVPQAVFECGLWIWFYAKKKPGRREDS